VGRQRCIISKKLLDYKSGRKQDPYNPTWEFKPLRVVILLSSSHKYVCVCVYIYIYKHTHTHTRNQCIRVKIKETEKCGV
jgi:hypothetical protein